jgi:hypothetical protein
MDWREGAEADAELQCVRQMLRLGVDSSGGAPDASVPNPATLVDDGILRNGYLMSRTPAGDWQKRCYDLTDEGLQVRDTVASGDRVRGSGGGRGGPPPATERAKRSTGSPTFTGSTAPALAGAAAPEPSLVLRLEDIADVRPVETPSVRPRGWDRGFQVRLRDGTRHTFAARRAGDGDSWRASLLSALQSTVRREPQTLSDFFARFPLLWDYEWAPPLAARGRGDLVFTDGQGAFAVVEAKHVPLARSGRAARSTRNEKRGYVQHQALRYARLFANALQLQRAQHNKGRPSAERIDEKAVSVEAFVYTNDLPGGVLRLHETRHMSAREVHRRNRFQRRGIRGAPAERSEFGVEAKQSRPQAAGKTKAVAGRVVGSTGTGRGRGAW